MPKLSICIPAYNRPDYLKFTLSCLKRDFPHAEIIVTDDCSPDVSYEQMLAICEGTNYWRHSRNIGPFPNMLSALQFATGDYAIYCADDDYLLPDEVEKVLGYLDAHPEVAAWCAPCEVWDEVNRRPYWNAFTAPERTFTKEEPLELFNAIIAHHIWPEHLIHRTPVAIKRRSRDYWCFADIPDILAHGAIHFSPTPFYRNLLVHPVGMRVQLGNEQALTHFDEYRGGLEILAYRLFGEQPYKTRHHIQQMIQSFICTRLDCARRLHEQAGNEFEAERFRQRLVIADPRPDTEAA